MKILFWFRKSESKNSDLGNPQGSIQCRIVIEGLELEIGSTQLKCRKSEWDAHGQSFRSTCFNYEAANRKLLDQRTSLSRVYDLLLTRYDYVTPKLVKEYFLQKRKFVYSIDEIFSRFFEFRERLVQQGGLTDSTNDVNLNYSRHIKAYCAQAGIIRPTQIPAGFLFELYGFLIENNRCGVRMGRKVVAFAKQTFKWGKKTGMCPHLECFDDDMPGTAESEDFIDTTHLSILQLEKLYSFDFYELEKRGLITEQTAQMLSHERNAFVFNCFTGMHHCDYSSKEFNIEPYSGCLFLRGRRKKTKKPFSIMLLEPAVNILKLYNNSLKELPTKSNQKRNTTLKLIAMYVGIPLRLTTKIARKTFCDIALNEMMMTQDDVAACLGLTSTKYLKNYGRVREKRLIKTMKNWAALKEAS
ncbi:hypothetical protein CLV98_1183 [Dyadobacter jejuensis]|uniref:Phage integrase SAM-like domain-containing protein n=1 Tax=Dyadobacter jejuensis TaxID=1082580 RepID=A0A316A918_9BACT|nr:hypothetical protein [Dyadobacter jejuensis]PWJ54245.1 hypothetical protein CLV98_1183 [Dyadobacter jejuensis]